MVSNLPLNVVILARPLGEARPLAEALVVGLLERLPKGTITRLEVGGSLRRWRESIGDVDILVVSDTLPL